MNVETRAREAASDVLVAVERMQRSPAGIHARAGSIEGFRTFEARRRRAQRVTAVAVAVAIAALGFAGLLRAFRSQPVPADEITVNNVADLELVSRVKLDEGALQEGGVLQEEFLVAIEDLVLVASDRAVAAYPSDCDDPCDPLWRTPPLGDLSIFPQIEGDLLLVGGQDGRAYAFPLPCDVQEGVCDPLWTTPAALRLDGRAVIQAGFLFASDGQRLIAFPLRCEAPNGICDPAWRSPALGPTFRVESVGDLVLVHTRERRLFGFATSCRPTDGVCEPLWRLDTPAFPHFYPLMQAGDRLLFVAFRAQDEDRPMLPADCVQRCRIVGSWSLPAAVPEGARSLFDWEATVLEDTVLLTWSRPRLDPFGGVVEMPLSCFGLPDCRPLWTARFRVRAYDPTVVVRDDVVAVGLMATRGSRGRILTFPLSCRSDGGECEPLAEIHSNYYPVEISAGVLYARGYTTGADAYPVECEAPCKAIWSDPEGPHVNHYDAVEVTGDRVFMLSALTGDPGNRLFVFGLGRAAHVSEGGPPSGIYLLFALVVGIAVVVGVRVRRWRRT